MLSLVQGWHDMEQRRADLHPLILVIDDEPPIRRFLRVALLAHGYYRSSENELENEGWSG
jgi:hypothetical protein